MTPSPIVKNKQPKAKPVANVCKRPKYTGIELFIVGKHEGDTWDFYGVFTRRVRAIRACKDSQYFFFKGKLNEEIPDTPTEVELVYPRRERNLGKYIPKTYKEIDVSKIVNPHILSPPIDTVTESNEPSRSEIPAKDAE